MTKTDRSLFLFTIDFPTGTAEAFIEKEIPVLSKKFGEITIASIHKKETTRALPANVKHVWLGDMSGYNGKKVLLRNVAGFISIFFYEWWREKDKKSFWKNRKYLRSTLLQSFFLKGKIEKLIEGNNQACYYSFWMNEWTIALAALKRKNKIRGFLTRVNGIDLFEERRNENLIPFRNFIIKEVDVVVAVSQHAYTYLEKKYPSYRHKIKLSRLGVVVPEENISTFKGVFVLVSCSNIIPLKRVELIARAVGQLGFPVNWIHFGDGPMLTHVEALTKHYNPEVKVNFYGQISNADLMNFYRTNHVDVFITVSSTEGGVPVSLQEAGSFGIALIGSDCGGISEIVSEETGFLLPADPTVEEITSVLEWCHRYPEKTAEKGKRARLKVMNEFNATKNYDEFIRILNNV